MNLAHKEPVPEAIAPPGRPVKLSIVVPSLNQGCFIEEALLSLLQQEGVRREELEVIVVDGGSSDQTLDVLRRFDGRVDYWVSEPDRGQTDALRKGFQVATGAVLGWLCADDLLTPRTVRSVLDFFAANPLTSFVYGDAIWITRSGQPENVKCEIPFSWFIWLHDHNYIPQPSAFWRREIYDSVGGLDSSFDLAMDADLFAKFALVAKPRHVGRIWSLVRRHPEQKTLRHRSKSDQEVHLVRERLSGGLDSRPIAAAKFAAAKLIRVLWKTLHGCYVPRPIARRIWKREMRRGILRS